MRRMAADTDSLGWTVIDRGAPSGLAARGGEGQVWAPPPPQAGEGRPPRLLGRGGERRGVHAGGRRRSGGLARGEAPPQQVALGEDADEAVALAEQDAAD